MIHWYAQKNGMLRAYTTHSLCICYLLSSENRTHSGISGTLDYAANHQKPSLKNTAKAAQQRDNTTYDHQRRVNELCETLAEDRQKLYHHNIALMSSKKWDGCELDSTVLILDLTACVHDCTWQCSHNIKYSNLRTTYNYTHCTSVVFILYQIFIYIPYQPPDTICN